MGIIGTGIDIIEIKRIKKAVDRNALFLGRVFTENEIDYFISRNNNPCHIAGTFAAKEAVLKALGTGISGVEWKEIEILRNQSGKPKVLLMGCAKEVALGLGIGKMHISISHSVEYAVAYAIAEGEE